MVFGKRCNVSMHDDALAPASSEECVDVKIAQIKDMKSARIKVSSIKRYWHIHGKEEIL